MSLRRRQIGKRKKETVYENAFGKGNLVFNHVLHPISKTGPERIVVELRIGGKKHKIGAVKYRILDKIGSKRKKAWIIEVFLDSKYKGKGIGKKMIEVVEEQMRRSGAVEVESEIMHWSLPFAMKGGYNVAEEEKKWRAEAAKNLKAIERKPGITINEKKERDHIRKLLSRPVIMRKKLKPK